MGIQDREWYQNEVRKRLDGRVNVPAPKPRRSTETPLAQIPIQTDEERPTTGRKSVHWVVAIMLCALAVIAVSALIKTLR
jgi:hypothetical protein